MPDRLGRLPLLLTWWIYDQFFGSALMERFKADFASVHTTRLDAKHYIQEDAPAEIHKAIEAFGGR